MASDERRRILRAGRGGAHNPFGRVEWVPEIDSTNRSLLDAARGGAASGTVLVADAQTAGRGRLGRTWTAPSGASLLVSVLLRPDLAPDRLGLLTLTAGIAAVDAVRELTPVEPQLKWPNDVVTSKGKLAGILAEAAGDAVVVGMGLNVDWPSVPSELEGIATALSLEGATTTRETLLDAWLGCWAGWLAIIPAPAGPQRVRRAWCRRSATLGRRVRAEMGVTVVEGVATDLTESGHLLITTDDGTVATIAAGDVVHLRPTPTLRDQTGL